MQSRLPKIRKKSLDRSTDRLRTHSRAGYQLHRQQLSSHPANTAGGKSHSHIPVRLGHALPKQEQDRINSLMNFHYENNYKENFNTEVSTVKNFAGHLYLEKGKKAFERQGKQC